MTCDAHGSQYKREFQKGLRLLIQIKVLEIHSFVKPFLDSLFLSPVSLMHTVLTFVTAPL